MTTFIDHQSHQSDTADVRHRQRGVTQIILAGAAAIAMLALFDAGWPSTAQTVPSGWVRLAGMTTDLPTPASAPFSPLYPQISPSLVSRAGFAADDSGDQAQQQAQQQIQQAEQQAEEQQELATQEAQQAEQQGLQTEQQANLSNS